MSVPIKQEATGLSEETTRRCQAVITQRLASMLGEEGVEILTEYIWHMITRPTTTKEHVCLELEEFLGSETKTFVDWLIAIVGPMINEDLGYSQNVALAFSQNINEQEGAGGNRLGTDSPSEAQRKRQHVPFESSRQDSHMSGSPDATMRGGGPVMESSARAGGISATDSTSNVPTCPPPPPPTSRAYNLILQQQQQQVQQMPSSITEMATPIPAAAPTVYVDPKTRVAMQLVPVPTMTNKDFGTFGVTPKKIKKRCARYPNCALGDECRYIHPSEMCRNWPRCHYLNECFYIHPEVECKFGVNCLNWTCNYTHPPERNHETLQARYNAYTGTFKNNTLDLTQTNKPTASAMEEQRQASPQQPQQPSSQY